MKGFLKVISFIIPMFIINANVSAAEVINSSDYRYEENIEYNFQNISKDNYINEYEVVNEWGKLPSELQKDLNSLKKRKGFYKIDNNKYGLKNDNLYLFISAGKKSGLGYSISIKGIVDINDELMAIINENSPKIKDINENQVSYPSILIQIPNKNYMNKFKVFKDGEELKRSVLGNLNCEVINKKDIKSSVLFKDIENLTTKEGFYLLNGKMYDKNDESSYFIISKKSLYEKNINVLELNGSDKNGEIVIKYSPKKNLKEEDNVVIVKINAYVNSVSIIEIVD